jgi:glycine/D-amino acid oxidase-like deaminating enzyme/nitrite reductase/ring-hydroxylating ferredoxin subunit
MSEDIKEKFDVAVIGGGWFGLNTALKLHENGKKVVVLDSHEVGVNSVASWSTAKVSSLQQTRASKVASKHNSHTLELYSRMNEEAINELEQIIGRYNIPCDWSRAAHIVFAQNDEDLKNLQQEEKAIKGANLHYITSDSKPEELPKSLQVLGVLTAKNQAHMNPVSYLLGLAEKLNQEGVQIYGSNRVIDVSFTSPHRITVANGWNVDAENIVVATHLPILDRTGHFALNKPSRSYCVAVALNDSSKNIQDTYISVDKEHTISFRPADDGKVLIVSGAGHPVGEYSDDKAWGYDPLIQWAKRHFDVKSVLSTWSAMDYYPADEIPYMGLAMHGMKSIYTATGFAKWGFSNGLAAANIVTDLMMDKENQYSKIFDARRWDITHSLKGGVEIGFDVAKHLVGDRFKVKTIDIEELVPDDGGIFKDKVSGDKVAVYRDKAGVIHKFSPSCTHLGCFVQWNCQDKIFECPCHGSCFTALGDVFHGPATRPLNKIGNTDK